MILAEIRRAMLLYRATGAGEPSHVKLGVEPYGRLVEAADETLTKASMDPDRVFGMKIIRAQALDTIEVGNG